jgi:TolA-binding protein
VRSERKDLTAHFEIEVTESRLARQWATVESRLPAPPPTGSKWRMLAAIGAPALVLCAWLGWAERARLPQSGALIESSDTPVAVQLRDGSSLELAAQTRLRVLRDLPSAVAVEVGDGRASFDVKHVPGRSFDVRAGAVSVRVVGTQFHVVKASRREGTEVEVAVKRGVVEVRRSDREGDVRSLATGETWSVWIPAEPVPQQSKPQLAVGEPASVAEPSPAPAKPSAAESAQPQVSPALAPALEAPQAPAKEAGVVGAGSAGLRGAARYAPGPPQPAAAKAQSSRALFLRANIARRAGRVQDAADAYAELLKRYPRDSRAGVAAFELGRIRMDALGDSRGAVEAFNEALALSRKAQFREDALARLAIASDASADAEGCRKARARYLTDYPAGVHAGSLGSLCGGTPTQH